jgi:hypothetical protein
MTKLPSASELSAKLQNYLQTDPGFRAVYEYTHKRFHAAPSLTAHNCADGFATELEKSYEVYREEQQ